MESSVKVVGLLVSANVADSWNCRALLHADNDSNNLSIERLSGLVAQV